MIKPLSAIPRRRVHVACLSPTALIWRPYFWVHQLLFIAITIFSALGIWYLAPYTYTSGGRSEYFTIAVQLIALWGAGVTLMALAKIDVEMSILGEVETKSTKYLRRIKSDQILRVDIDRLEEDTLPNNLSEPPPGMIRLFKHICKEAKDRRFESSINVIQPYREESLEDIFKLQNLQKIALWLGILGTFVGLLLVVSNSGVNTAQTNEEFAALIKRMFDGLIVSFSASLAGLEVAVILGLFLLLLRRKQELYFKLMESTAVTMLSVARHTIVRDDFLNEFAQISNSVNLLGDRVYQQTQELSRKLTAVEDRINHQTTSIQQGMTQLTKVKTDLESSITSLSKAQKEFVDDVRKIYSAVALKDLTVGIENGIKQAGKQISITLEPNVKSIATELGAFAKVLQSLNSVVSSQSSEMTESAKRVERRVSELTVANERSVRDLGKEMQTSLTKVEGNVGRTLKGELQQLSVATSRLTDAVQQAKFTRQVPDSRNVYTYRKGGVRGFFDTLRDWYNS